MAELLLRRLIQIVLIFGIALVAAVASDLQTGDQQLRQKALESFQPLPPDMASKDFPINSELVALGRMLFFEPRVSLDGTVSCAKCHQSALYGTDSLPKAIGVMNRLNPRNAPTVLNAALQSSQHWRGDRLNVEDQAKRALVGPPSFGQPDYSRAMSQLAAISGYQELFKQAFPGESQPINADNWARAIGAYERTLVTPAPFDRFLKGDDQAISDEAKAGLRIFIDTGCSSCHGGAGVGGGLLMKFGLVEDYWKATGSQAIDRGRFDVTGEEADRYLFKVPSLRNVAMTAPYFHDGSVATLPEAVRVMARVQLAKTLSQQQVSSIVAFLQSLTGTLPENFARAPVLPPGSFAH